MLLHVDADEREQLTAATHQELLTTAGTTATIVERLYAPEHLLTALQKDAAGLHPRTLPGLAAHPIQVRPITDLGKLIHRRSYRARWPLIGWDLPWTLSRLALHTGKLKGKDGFTIALEGSGVYKNGVWKPSFDHSNLTIESRYGTEGGAFYRWTRPRNKPRPAGEQRPDFLDLQVLTSALAGSGMTDPAHACAWFGVPWPDPTDGATEALRAQTAALAALYVAVMGALEQTAPGLAPGRVWSFGSLADHALASAGVGSPAIKAEHLPVADLGDAVSAMHGGLFQARLVGVSAPMVLVDIVSTYPSMFSLLGLTPVLACERFDVTRASPSDFLDLLAGASLRDWQTWRQLGLTFVVLRPHGEELPASADSGRSFGLTVAPLNLAGGALCFHWTDVAAAITRGADPTTLDIQRVFTLVPVGTKAGLRPLRLPTGRLVDLTVEDLGTVLKDERIRAKPGPRRVTSLLKSMGNSLTYGSLARSDASTVGTPVQTIAYGPGGEAATTTTSHPETPGPHAFLPAAASVAGAARLIVAMVSKDVDEASGVIAAVHADSFAVLCAAHPPGSPETGTNAGTMTPAKLGIILDTYASLGIDFKWDVPADPAATGLVIGVNRVIYTSQVDALPGVVRSSDAGLGGHVADPSNHPGARTEDGRWRWAAHCELAISQTIQTDNPDRGLAIDAALLPDWTQRPVLHRHQARTWTALKALRTAAGDPAVQPFTRYLSASASGPVAVGQWRDARTWHLATWVDHGQSVGLDTLQADGTLEPFTDGDEVAVLPSIGAYLVDWANPIDPATRGPRRGPRTPLPVWARPGTIHLAGKDGIELGADGGTSSLDPGEERLVYGAIGIDHLRRQVISAGIREVARRSELRYETLRRWTSGATTSDESIAAIAKALSEADAPQPTTSTPECALLGCREPARPRSPFCSDSHRVTGTRRRRALEASDLVAPPSER